MAYVTDLIAEDLMIDSDTPGIRLHLRHKTILHPDRKRAREPLLLVHGATFGSGSLFDVPLGGESFMDRAATDGFDVYALDIRGYGSSTRPKEMEQPAGENAPIVRTETAVRDLTCAVEYLRARLQVEQVNLFAMSWGGSIAGAYAAKNSEKLRKLVLLAPLWLSTKPLRIAARAANLGAYRTVPVLETKAGWMEGVPEDKRKELLPSGWFEQWAEATLANHRSAAQTEAQTILAPSGAVQDVLDCWMAGKPLYDPAEIEVPVLLLRAAWDVDVSLDMAFDLFRRLTGSPERRWVELAEGTHLVLLEKNRGRAMEAILSFLDGQA